MKNLIVLAVALFATNAVAAEMKWNGSAGWRYSQTKTDDNLGSKVQATNQAQAGKDVSVQKRRDHAMRASLGVTGGWEHVEYGFGVRTMNAANDDYIGANVNADRPIGIEQAWFRYLKDFGSMDMSLTIGRQKNALIYDSQWETLFDNDVRFDGFGWNFKFGMFGFNAAQYIIGAQTAPGTVGASSYQYTEASEELASSKRRFANVFAFQPYMNWKFSDEIEAMLSLGFYKWSTAGAFNNGTRGGLLENFTADSNTAGTVIARTANQYRMDNKTQFDLLANISLPMNMNVVFNWVKSSNAHYDAASLVTAYGTSELPNPEVSNKAWTLGLTYGKLRKARDFTLGYAFTNKGIASVMNTLSNDKFKADNKGHTILAGYSLADNFNLGAKAMIMTEKERIDTTSANIGAGGGLPYNNAQANQKQDTLYWELTAGVAF